jgi:hypothetical protein
VERELAAVLLDLAGSGPAAAPAATARAAWTTGAPQRFNSPGAAGALPGAAAGALPGVSSPGR